MRITAPLRVVVSLARRPKAARSCAPQGFVNGDGFIAVRRSPVNRARSPTTPHLASGDHKMPRLPCGTCEELSHRAVTAG